MLLLLIFGDATGFPGDHPTSVTWIPSEIGDGGALVSGDSTIATWVVGDTPENDPIYLTDDAGAFITTDSGSYIIIGYSGQSTVIPVASGGIAVVVNTGNSDSSTVNTGGRPLSSVWVVGDSATTSITSGDQPTANGWTSGDDVATSPIYLTTDSGDYITTDSGAYIITGTIAGDNNVTISTGNAPTTVTW